MKSKIILFLVLFLSVFLAGCELPSGTQGAIRNFEDCVNAGYPIMESYPRQCAVPGGETFTEVIPEPVSPPGLPIGGERDEYGCLGPAGYSWNEEANACIREWELNESQRRAAKIAVDHVGWVYATTIIGVDVLRCPGCFVVHVENGDGRNRIDVSLIDWEIKERTLTPDECEAKGGHPVNIVGGVACPEGETDIGKVTGFISPNICCLKSGLSVAEECEEAGGTWLNDYNECEYVGREWCESRGGEFLECESACRHDPEAEICTLQCVLVCKL